jgi:acyl carrier protein
MDTGIGRKEFISLGNAALQPNLAMTRDTVFTEIARLLERFRAGDTAISYDTVIAEDLTMDSLQVMDLMMELEDRFDVSIPLNLVPEIATVGQLADTIHASKVQPIKAGA